MNSNYGKSNTKSGSLNAFDFDLGLNSSGTRSMNDRRNQTSSYSSSSSFTGYSSKPSTTSSWTQPPNKPSWTHQPAASYQAGGGSASGSTSMVGDIFGKSWSSSGPSSTANTGIGIAKKDPNLFGDLLNSALGQNKGNSNVPLKNATPAAASKSTFSMGSMADSLPKPSNSAKNGSLGNASGFNGNNNARPNVGMNANANKTPNLGGPALKSMSGSGVGGGMGSNKDPFGSLVDFGSKPSGGMNSASKGNSKSKVGDDEFGDFQNASKTNTSTMSSSNSFEGKSNSTGSSTGASYTNMGDFGFASSQFPTQPPDQSTGIDDFGFASSQSQNQPPMQSSGINDFDSLFSSSGGPTRGTEAFEGQQQFSGGDDWGLDSDFGGGNDTGATTELEGLPPPPAGVSASTAKSKGMDNYKQGQYADAIKWLSWSVILLEKAGDDAGTMEVLSCRASCYKEAGEYKKAVADCTKVWLSPPFSFLHLIICCLFF